MSSYPSLFDLPTGFILWTYVKPVNYWLCYYANRIHFMDLFETCFLSAFALPLAFVTINIQNNFLSYRYSMFKPAMKLLFQVTSKAPMFKPTPKLWS
jgi:hypothetical protein